MIDGNGLQHVQHDNNPFTSLSLASTIRAVTYDTNLVMITSRTGSFFEEVAGNGSAPAMAPHGSPADYDLFCAETSARISW